MMKVCHDYELELQRKLLAAEARIAELYNENQALKEDARILYDDYNKLLPEATASESRAAELERQVADLCPIGDLVGLPAWQVEKQGYMDRIAELERVLGLVEWIRRSDMVPGYCPWCDNDKPDGHADDCPRQEVLNDLTSTH
jgi:hypothetical protein